MNAAILFSVLSFFAAGVSSPSAFDAAHSGRASVVTPRVTKGWDYRIPPEGLNFAGIFGSPALSRDGTLFVSNSRIAALDCVTGEEKWTQRGLGYPGADPLALPDGTLLLALNTGLLALDPKSSEIRWKNETVCSLASTPVLSPEGWLTVGTGNGRVVSVEAAAGKFRWEFSLPQDLPKPDTVTAEIWKGRMRQMFSSPVLGEDGTIYVSGVSRLYALDNKTGKLRWQAPTESDFAGGSPGLGSEGRVYLGICQGTKGTLAAFSTKTGAKKWEYAVSSSPLSSISVERQGEEERIYTADYGGEVVAFRGKTGELLWKHPTGKPVQTSFALGRDGRLYFGDLDKTLYALDRSTGKQVWSKTLDGPIQAGVVLGSDDTLFAATMKGTVFAIPASERK